MTLTLTSLLVKYSNFSITIHNNLNAFRIFNRVKIIKSNRSRTLTLNLCLLNCTTSCTTYMECTHSQLRTRLPNGLSSDYPNCFTTVNHMTTTKITTITLSTNTTTGTTGKNGSNPYFIDTNFINLLNQCLGNFLTRFNDYILVVKRINNIFLSNTAKDSITKWNDDLSTIEEWLCNYSIKCLTIRHNNG